MSQPIRVMQIIARMNVGGPAVIVADLMRGIDKQVFDQRLLTGFCAAGEADYLDQVATDIKAQKINGLGRSISPLQDLKSFLLLLRLIRKFKPNIIHTHTAKAGVLGRIAGLIAYPRALRIHTFHGHLLNGYFNTHKTKLVIITERLLAQWTHLLLAVGNQVREDLLKVRIGTEDKFKVSLPGLPFPVCTPRLKARELLGLEQDKTYLVFVGRLTGIKRPDRLIALGRELKARKSNAEILIAGEGGLFASTQEISRKELLPLKFLGWRNDVDLILSASDVAILCSDNEGIPLTLIQAAMVGLPIVSTNVGSVRDIVIDGKTGILTSPHTEAFVQEVMMLLNDEKEWHRLGDAGRCHAEAVFSLSGMIDAHSAIYTQMLEVKR
ncbi:MAG: glycosyltransferase [Actinobacteria bacterium]|uniref:Unannotated protein n=1 Tax=freshwater metagenome TaxID=449393 RepID=A0A6J7XQ43_9ZZZZ|nr:glycosyltransferase [Actinomycetota bacterium]MSX57947.1 glycosyltransferase [Actinomycetota bacterium]